jgi:hypothetical protein
MVSGQVYAPDLFTSGHRAPGTHWIGGWMDPRAGLDAVEKGLLPLPGIEPRSFGSWPSRYADIYPGTSFEIMK